MKTMTTSHTQTDSDAPAPFAGDRSHADPQLILRCLGVLRRARDLGDAEIAGAVHDLLIDWHSRGDRLRAADRQVAAMRTYQSTLLDDIREMKQKADGQSETCKVGLGFLSPPDPSSAMTSAVVCDALGKIEPKTESRAPVPMPEDLRSSNGSLVAFCIVTAEGRFIDCKEGICIVSPRLATAWLCRAVDWVRDGEVGR